MNLDASNGDASRGIVRDVPVGDFDEFSVNAESTGSQKILHQSVDIAGQKRWEHYYHRSRARLRGMRQMPIARSGLCPGALNLSTDKGQAKQRPDTIHQIVYRNVCTEQDPPVSVAISPIRLCVAFGCQGGIELYWIDPQTNQNLNRWFPLIKPSPYLYFLPPRRHIDSESRLRLISSSNFTDCGIIYDINPPQEIPAIHTRISAWFTPAASWQFRTPREAKRQAYTLDHSQAVPLSDGHHILFIDNATGLLCLGSDKPLGSVHRLSRKFVFVPPTEIQIKLGGDTLPRVYATSSDLSLGTRVVATYGDYVVLYSVPADALKYSTAEQENATQTSTAPSFRELETLQLLKHPLSNAPALRDYYPHNSLFDEVNMKWIHYLPVDGEPAKSLEEVWPLQISGSVFGKLDGIVSLSVLETAGEGPVVWAFSKFGVAKAWRVDDGETPVLSLRSEAGRDGVVVEENVKVVG